MMTKNVLLLLIQKAIAHPDNKYKTPYARTSVKAKGKEGFLYIDMIDAKKAAESVLVTLKELKLIDYEEDK